MVKNMVKFDDIVERIKDVICHEFKDGVVYDKNVAHELGMNQYTFYSCRKRETIPYDELTMFCIRRRVNTNWLFFGIGSMEMSYA